MWRTARDNIFDGDEHVSGSGTGENQAHHEICQAWRVERRKMEARGRDLPLELN
jgi:hypothetical protein